MSESRACAERSLIDRHFAGRASPEGETRMRAHVGGCAPCQHYYERRLLLSELDPAAPPARERLAAGLGIGRRRRAPAAQWTAGLTLGAAAAAALVLVLRPPRPDQDAGFAGRGTAPPAAAPGAAPPGEAPALEIYCSSCGKPAPRLGGSLGARASLAFAYSNPTGRKRLMVLAVDESKHVYWFYPDLKESQVSVAIERTAVPTELPWEIDQSFAGRALRILGLFSDEPLAVNKVEALVDGTGCASLRALGATCVEKVVAIERPR
jgi:hypothetical protein